MALVIFRLQVKLMLRQQSLDLVMRKHPERRSGREVGYSSKGRSRPIRIRHAAILL
jgi:hypothetical protein